MFFRSHVEVTIAAALDRRKVRFLGKARGRFANCGTSAADRRNVNNGRFETDFLMFYAKNRPDEAIAKFISYSRSIGLAQIRVKSPRDRKK